MPLAYHTAAELFQGISESEAQKVARLCAERRYRKGATIFSKDDSADSPRDAFPPAARRGKIFPV